MLSGAVLPAFEVERRDFLTRELRFAPSHQGPLVLALVERGGRVRARPIADVTGETLHKAIRHNVTPAAQIQTDELSAYHGIGRYFEGGHETVSHKKREYARGSVTTNEAEAFFALLKRGVVGSFHSVSKHHLHRYCDEFSYRWNERKTTDEARTLKALGLIEGKRLMYKEPIRRA